MFVRKTVLLKLLFGRSRSLPFGVTMQSESSQIKQFFSNQVVFLTGGSGFLGKVLIEKLLRDCDIEKIYVLIRSKKNKSPERRFKELFDYPCFDLLKSTNFESLQKVYLINGDCQEPHLGLSDVDLNLLVEETTCVIHAAANVKFDQSLKEASYNVRATRDLLRLAEKMLNLKVFVYVSTAFSNCLHSHIKESFYEPPIKPENLLSVVNSLSDSVLQVVTPPLLGEWPNTYIYTKSISEDLVKEAGDKFPITIVRPAIVVSTIEEPMPGWIDNFYGVVGIVLAAAMGVLRSLNAKLDASACLVPVDYVSNCVLAAAWKGSSSSDTIIYNYVGHKKTRLTWKKFIKYTEVSGWKTGSEKVVWYYCLKIRENKMWHKICIFFLHTVPAHIADFALTCVGREPIAVKNYLRLNKLLDSISYFSTKSWEFDDDNVMNLWTAMNEEDKRVFGFNMEQINWQSYADQCIAGGQRYLLKESPESIERGKRKLRLLGVLHYTLLALFWFLMYKFIMFVFRCFV